MLTLLNKRQFQFSFFNSLLFIFIAVAVYTEHFYLIGTPFIILLFYIGWGHSNFLFFLLLFTLPFSFEYNFSSSLGTDLPDEPLMVLVSILFLFFWIYSKKIISKNILSHPLLALLFISIMWSVLTVVFSSEKLISVKYLLAKSWYIGAFVLAPIIVFRKKENIKLAAVILSGSLLLITVIALLRHSFHWFRFQNINEAVSPFFRNHVSYSAMLVCVIPIFYAFYQLSKKRKNKNLIIAAILILMIALFFSYARGAWLALVAGAIAYWLIKKKLLVFTYFSTIIITISFLFWLKNDDRYLQFANDYKTTIFHKDFRKHLIATYQLKDVSTAERFYRWIAGVRMIKDNWLTGYGSNTFYYNYKSYAIPTFKTWVSKNEDRSTVHNYFLLTAIESGIPGLFFLLLLLGAMLYYSQAIYHRAEDLFYKIAAITVGVIISMIIVVNFLSDLIETDKIGSLFFLCLSTLIALDIKSQNSSKSFPSNIQGIS